MAANFEGREHDGTAAMANAFFGTPGCEGAIDRVFGVLRAPNPEEGKTDNQVQAAVPEVKSPLFLIPEFEYTVDLRLIQGVTDVYKRSDIEGWTEADTKEYFLHSFSVHMDPKANSLELRFYDRLDVEGQPNAVTRVNNAREALLKAWYDYTKEGA